MRRLRRPGGRQRMPSRSYWTSSSPDPRKPGAGIRFNEHIEADGLTVFKHACKLGLEGIVSKRKDSPYRSGRTPDWLKMKDPACEAVKREEEEDWGKRR
jgi:ATP-dependent DNA ligase